MAKLRSTLEPPAPQPGYVSPGLSGANEPQDIEELKQRYEKLKELKTKAETNLENAQKTLNELKKQARENYQTDVLEELEAKLEDMKAENKRKRSEYQSSLDTIAQDLNKVERKYAEGHHQGEDEQ